MVYNATSAKNGILQKCEFYLFGSNYGSITGDTTRLAEFTSLCNDAMDSASDILLSSDNTWQWDDTNYTTFPIAVTDLVDNQADYSLETTHHKIESVEALDSTGNYYPLYPIDTSDIMRKGLSPTEYYEDKGLPQFYDKLGNSLVLYPAPDSAQVTAMDGLKVRFQRSAEYFTTSDTTKEPGFSSIYHILVPLYASFEYAVANDMTNKMNILSAKIAKEESKLKRYMQSRNKDERPIISMRIKQAK